MNRILESKLFGFALGDGWMSKSYTDNTMFYQFGFSGDIESLLNTKRDLINLYGNIGKATLRSETMTSPKYGITGTTTQFTCNQKVAKRFIKLGMPIGKKVEIDWEIPSWIINGDEEIKSSFLSGFYAAEGYTPTMQKNDITLKAPGFNFHKRTASEKNYWHIVDQFKCILDSLSIKYSFFKKEKFTCDNNLVAEFIISNEHKNVIHFFNLLDLDYSIEKEQERQIVISYYKEKDKILLNMSKALEESRDRTNMPKYISEKYGVSINTVNGWRKRNTLEAKLPNNFIKYTEFKKQQLSLV